MLDHWYTQITGGTIHIDNPTGKYQNAGRVLTKMSTTKFTPRVTATIDRSDSEFRSSVWDNYLGGQFIMDRAEVYWF